MPDAPRRSPQSRAPGGCGGGLDLTVFKGDKRKLVRLKERDMTAAVKRLDFETAAILRDEIAVLKGKEGRVKTAPRKRR